MALSKSKIAGILSGLGMFCVVNPLSALAVTLSPSLAGTTSATGTGLNGTFYDIDPVIGTLAEALSASVGAPSATFISSSVNYSANDNTPLSTYLGSDGSTLSGLGSTTLQGSYFTFTGYLYIDTAQDLNFSLASDDGSSLSIEGVELINNDGLHGLDTLTTDLPITFTASGFYAVSIAYFESGGGTGVRWGFSPTNTFDVVPTGVLFNDIPNSVPEPSPFVFTLGFGIVLGSLLLRRTRKLA